MFAGRHDVTPMMFFALQVHCHQVWPDHGDLLQDHQPEEGVAATSQSWWAVGVGSGPARGVLCHRERGRVPEGVVPGLRHRDHGVRYAHVFKIKCEI